MKWSADKVISVKTTKRSKGEACYRQDLVLHSQRIIRTHTGVMRYSQRIRVDKIGRGNYCAFVDLDPDVPGTLKKPFNSLGVYVGLAQQGKDVHIYAAGVFEVNRKVVPNLIVFDASGLAGDMAGKGTLWLAGHFEEMQRTTAKSAQHSWSSTHRISKLKWSVLQRVSSFRGQQTHGIDDSPPISGLADDKDVQREGDSD